ncbi:MAG TPA: TolC family protein [Candidatus Aminicenantes bacterium]|nr:TolC family protein [Candidatus Aminicenantes bacterium]
MKKMIAMVVLAHLLALLGPAQERPVKSLSLEEVINQALKNNLDLQIEMANPEIAKALLRKSRAVFIPSVGFSFRKTSQTTPNASIVTGVDVEKPESVSYGFSLKQQLPIGGSLDVALQNSRYSTNSLDVYINPRYFSQLQFTLSQPLLKNFGLTATRRSIILARHNQDKSLATLRQQVIDLIYQTEEAYWNLVYSHQNLEVKEKSLQLAKDLLKQNETQVRVGVSAPMDILTAQAEVAAREGEVLQARSQIQAYEENLRRILNTSQAPETIVPADQPLFRPRQADFNEFLEKALAKRPDIEQVRLDLKSRNIDVRYYRNQTLPDLQLTASYYTQGLSGMPLKNGIPIPGVVGGGMSDALRDALKRLYENYSLGLQLSVPVVNASARADLAQARLNLEQSLLTLKKTESTVYSEVKQIIMDLETNAKLVEATRISRELAEQKLAAEQKKLAVGLSTNYQVLQYQRDFANARIAELKSLIDYSLSLSRVGKVLGTTLDEHNIDFAGFQAEG